MNETRPKRPPHRVPADAVEAATATGRDVAGETAAAVAALPQALPPKANPLPGAADLLTVFEAAQAAFARGAEAVADELTGLARAAAAVSAEAAGALLGAKTLGDALDANAGFARKSIDTLLAGSARLSQIGTRFAAEAWQPPIHSG